MFRVWTSPRRTRMLSLGQKKTCIWLGSSSSCNSFPSLGFSFFSALPPFRCFLAFELAFSGQVRECTSLIENSPTSSEEEVKILRTSIRKSFREYKGVLVSQVAIDIRSTICDFKSKTSGAAYTLPSFLFVNVNLPATGCDTLL